MTQRPTTSAEFFEEKYQLVADPWDFATDNYEQERYQLIMGHLEGGEYSIAFEPGCSIGVLTERLARLCGKVYASDFSATAVARSRARCEHLQHVVVDCAELNSRTSIHAADLVVLSEIGYYFTEAHWVAVVDNIVSQMAPRSVLLAAHWLGRSEDHVRTGDQVHQTLMEAHGLELQIGKRFPLFRLDRWIRRS